MDIWPSAWRTALPAWAVVHARRGCCGVQLVEGGLGGVASDAGGGLAWPVRARVSGEAARPAGVLEWVAHPGRGGLWGQFGVYVDAGTPTPGGIPSTPAL